MHIILTFKSYHGIQSLHYHNGGRVTTIISNICRKKTPFLLGMGEGGTQINFDTFLKVQKFPNLHAQGDPPAKIYLTLSAKVAQIAFKWGVGALLKLILRQNCYSCTG